MKGSWGARQGAASCLKRTAPDSGMLALRKAGGTFAILCGLFSWASNGWGDTHYAARPETNPDIQPVYPYTSCETAASSIGQAMEVADAGDVVNVLPGTYGWPGTGVVMKAGVELRGSDPELTRLLGDLQLASNTLVSGFRFVGCEVGYLSWDQGSFSGIEVRDCVFENAMVNTQRASGDEVTIRRCRFRGGGPIEGMAIRAYYDARVEVLGCEFVSPSDSPPYTCAIGMHMTDCLVEGCRFVGYPTGMEIALSTACIANCVLRDNRIGIFQIRQPGVELRNCTLFRNGTGIVYEFDSIPVIVDSIIWGNLEAAIEARFGAAPAIVTYSDVQGAYEGEGNIDADPRFRSESEDEPDLHLRASSPCIDAGDPASPYDMEPQPNGGRVNMGAYGNTPEATATPHSPFQPDTHYAGDREINAGSFPVYPYTSPETAACEIQDAIEAADAGDTVMVLPGTYGSEGAVYFMKDGVDLAGSGPDRTTLQGEVNLASASAVSGLRVLDGVFQDGTEWEPNTDCMVTGCVFENSWINSYSGNPTVRRCHFIGAPVTYWRGFIHTTYGGVEVYDCVIAAERDSEAVGIETLEASAGQKVVVRRCRFSGCTTGIHTDGGDLDVSNSIFNDNELGVYTGFYKALITNCTFFRNGCGVSGGSYYYVRPPNLITNCIFWGNLLATVDYQPDLTTVTCSDVEGGYPGPGNIDADPLFRDPSGHPPDLHLRPDSPCIDAGDPSSDYTNEPEPNGWRVNMGAYGNTWEATTSELVDTDADNMRDDWEIRNFGSLAEGWWGDADGDRLFNGEEYRRLSDPNDPDTDEDGISDGEEVYYCCTDPTVGDTDNDGTPDGKEVSQGTDPLDWKDAFTILNFSIQEGYLYVTFPTLPGYEYSLESSNWPNGPFGFTVDPYRGRYGVLTHTHVLRLGPYNRFFRIKAREYPGGETPP